MMRKKCSATQDKNLFSVDPNIFRIHELIFAKKHLRLTPDSKALDLACGIGFYTSLLLGKCKMAFGSDISLNNIKIANHFRQNNTFFYLADAENISHPDSTFDIVISICALEHFSNPENAIREIHRVLKHGGQVLLTVDSLQTIKSEDFIDFHKKYCLVRNYFTVEGIKSILQKYGFEVELVKAILNSKLSTALSICAFKIMDKPLLFNMFSIISFPLTLLADAFSTNNKGITIGVYAKKK